MKGDLTGPVTPTGLGINTIPFWTFANLQSRPNFGRANAIMASTLETQANIPPGQYAAIKTGKIT
jgi:hypothetical protein